MKQVGMQERKIINSAAIAVAAFMLTACIDQSIPNRNAGFRLANERAITDQNATTDFADERAITNRNAYSTLDDRPITNRNAAGPF